MTFLISHGPTILGMALLISKFNKVTKTGSHIRHTVWQHLSKYKRGK